MKKNGFTLIELLVIIVLLAIISLVATPVILDILQNTKKNGFASSVSGIKDAIETDYSDKDFDITRNTYTYEDGKLYDNERNLIPMSGGISGGYGKGTVDDRGNVKVWIYNNQYCGTMGYESKAGVSVANCNGLSECEKACKR